MVMYGKLKVIKELEPVKIHDGKRNRTFRKMLCSCCCGTEVITDYANLRAGKINSFGCIRADKATKHGKSHTRLYKILAGMKQRCNNASLKCYKYYGGKGIKVCEEWSNSFEVFEKWATENGYSDELTIDRIDSDKNYCPENCQWITFSENIAKSNIRRGR